MPNTFRGGIHIDDHKSLTSRIPTKRLGGCTEHVFPLQQHIGAPLEAVVSAGDRVTAGQKIADTESFLAAPVHSSISGTVKAVEPRPHPSGAKVTSIVIENDFLNTRCPSLRPSDPDVLSPAEMRTIIREAGIVGMGGAGFPTHVKLSPPEDKPISYIIINGAECEPYLTSDHRRMLEYPDDILAGLRIAMRVLGVENGYVGIESNKPDAIETMIAAAREYPTISVVPLKTKYPQGAEKQLIKAITRRTVPSGGLPADVGVIILNIDTAVAIAHVFETGMPLTERIVTVSGDCIRRPANYIVPLGVPLSYLVEQAGGFSSAPKKIILGGPMMGTAQYTLDVPVIKTSSALLALSDLGETYDDVSPCIRCGKCVKCCPMHLMPLSLNQAVLDGDLEKAEKYHVLDCIECGICSYLCPGRQNPLQNIRLAKQKILENRRKNR